jgi:RNA polymerase sigma-54 factor
MGTPGLNIQPSVNLSQQLRLVLNPRMLQLLKTLHLPYTDLLDSINKETTENPALDVEKTDELIAYAHSLRSGKSTATPSDFDASRPDKEIKDLGPTLQSHLIEQLHLEELEEQDFKIAEYLVQNIDDRGYLSDYPKIREEIVDSLKVKSCRVDKILGLVQTLEPEGVGARNLKECLLIQVNEYNFESEELQKIIYAVLKYHFEDLAKKKFEKIANELEIEPEGVEYIAEFVEKNLTPAPGHLYRTDRQEQTIIPSFAIKTLTDPETGITKFSAENL